MDMKKLMQEAQKMQQELTTKMKAFDEKVFNFDYKGLISIEILGSLKIVSYKIIDKSIVDASDLDMLQDVISQATNNAISAIIQGKSELTTKIAGPGLDGIL